MLPTMFWFIWQSGFREDFLEINQSETRIACAAMFVNGSELNEQSLLRAFQGYFLPSFDSFGKVVLELEVFQKSTNQKQELLLVAMFVNRSELNEQSFSRTLQGCFLPSFGSQLHLAKRLQRRRFFQKSTNQKQELVVVAMFVNRSEDNEQSL